MRISAGGNLTAGADGLQIEATDLDCVSGGLVVQPADVHTPLPVATAGAVAGATVPGLDGRDLPIAAALRLPAIPGVGAPAALVDLEYADGLAVDAAPSANATVHRLRHREPSAPVAATAVAASAAFTATASGATAVAIAAACAAAVVSSRTPTGAIRR